MDRAEFKVAREALGLSGEQVASSLGVGARAVRRWEMGGSAVSAAAAEWIERAGVDSGREVAREAARVRRMREPRVITYATDALFLQAYPRAAEWQTARWHRTIAARVAREVPGTVIVFAEDL